MTQHSFAETCNPTTNLEINQRATEIVTARLGEYPRQSLNGRTLGDGRMSNCFTDAQIAALTAPDKGLWQRQREWNAAFRQECETLKTAARQAFLDEQQRYEADAAYRAEQDASRAARQTIVSDRMSAQVARFHAKRRAA